MANDQHGIMDFFDVCTCWLFSLPKKAAMTIDKYVIETTAMTVDKYMVESNKKF